MAANGGSDTLATDKKRTGISNKDCQGGRSVDSTASLWSSCSEMADQEQQQQETHQNGSAADKTGSDTSCRESPVIDNDQKGHGSTRSDFNQPPERQHHQQSARAAARQLAKAKPKPSPLASNNPGERSSGIHNTSIRSSITLPDLLSFAVGLPVVAGNDANGNIEPNGAKEVNQPTTTHCSTKEPHLKRLEGGGDRSTTTINGDRNEGQEPLINKKQPPGDISEEKHLGHSYLKDDKGGQARKSPPGSDDAVNQWWLAENIKAAADYQGGHTSRDQSPTRADSQSSRRRIPAAKKSCLKRGSSFDPAIGVDFPNQNSSRLKVMTRSQSQPMLYPDNSLHNRGFPLSPRRQLQSQAIMTERLTKLRNSVSTRPVRLKKKPITASRSKSHIPSTMSKHHIWGNFEEKGEGASKESFDDDNNNNEEEEEERNQQQRGSKRQRRRAKRTLSLPSLLEIETPKQRALKAFRERADQGRTCRDSSRRRSPSHFSGGDNGGTNEEEETDDNDVLLMIAKARAKLEMQGNGSDHAARVQAETVLAHMTQQHNDRDERVKQKEALAASSGHSRARSAASSGGGTASSLPGAYEKVPGGEFERKQAFSQASIMRQHNANTKQRQKQSQSQPQQHESHESSGSFPHSDLGSISSNDSESMSDEMEIEFSKESISNHDENCWGYATKPPAKEAGSFDGDSPSPCGSEASLSLNPDHLFSQQKTPAETKTKSNKGSPQRSGSKKRGTGSSKGFSAVNHHASFASLPAVSGLSSDAVRDYDSDDSSYTRRPQSRRHSTGRGRHHQSMRYDHSRRTSSCDEYVGNSEPKKPYKSMKDGSTESDTSQLVIAAEVVRSEEELVHELRQKVTKDLLESMAKELNEMEASMSVLSVGSSVSTPQSSLMDMSGTANDHIPSAPSGSRVGIMQRMTTLTGRQSQEVLKPTANRRQEVPPSPMSTSVQNTPKSATPNNARRRGKSLNLRGVSPRFLRSGRSPGRSSSMKLPYFSGKKKMPKLIAGSSCGSESSSNEDEVIPNRRSTGNMDIIDAVSVIPEHEPAPAPARRPRSAPRRSVSQPTIATNRPAASRRRPSGTHLQAHLRPGSLLDQLRTMKEAAGSSTAASAALQEVSVTCTNLQRGLSGDSHVSSLPDLMPQPSLTAGTSQGTVRSNDDYSNQRATPPPHGQQPLVAPRPPSLSSGLSGSRPRTPTPSSLGSISANSEDDDDDNNWLNPAARSQEQDGVAEYHVVNPHEGIYPTPATDIPSDWDLQQLEMVELGRHSHASTSLVARGPTIPSSSAEIYRTMVSNSNTGHEQPVMISYDNELPIAWATPVCLLVVGAVVLAVVLFAA